MRKRSKFSISVLLSISFVLVALPAASVRARATTGPIPTNDSVVLLLQGIYKHTVHGPNYGLSAVNLSDGTYDQTDIYRVSEPGTKNQAIGTFYISANAPLCAYHLAGGSLVAAFTDFSGQIEVINGEQYLVGTAELVIQEATGTYESFNGGSIHMEFSTHIIDDVTIDEYCFCFIHR